MNLIGPAGAKHLADNVQRNTHLKTLFLVANALEDDGAKHIADCLRYNTGLQAIYMGSNGITASGANHFLSALSWNAIIRVLDVGLGSWAWNGQHILASKLKRNEEWNVSGEVVQMYTAPLQAQIKALEEKLKNCGSGATVTSPAEGAESSTSQSAPTSPAPVPDL